MASSSHNHMMRTGDFNEKKLHATLLDERTARLPDGTRLRVTPKGQKTVEELVFQGDEIKSNYGSHGQVIEVKRYLVYGLPTYTIIYVPLDAQPNKDGSYRDTVLRWINECVAQDGKILKLFEGNSDEVQVVKTGEHQLKLDWF